MSQMVEVVRIALTGAQNAALAASLGQMHGLKATPRVSKELFVTKESYTASLRKKLREKGMFQAAIPFDQMHFDPSDLKAAHAVVKFEHAGHEITLTEQLDVPDGVVKHVELTDKSLEPELQTTFFSSYIEAEREVVCRLGLLEDFQPSQQ